MATQRAVCNDARVLNPDFENEAMGVEPAPVAREEDSPAPATAANAVPLSTVEYGVRFLQTSGS